MTTKRSLRVLFLCSGNSCRSQMAEGWARHLVELNIEPASAGIRSSMVDPMAIRVMAEAGVDISRQRSKLVSEVWDREFDLVVTVCDAAAAACPVFPAPVPTIHHGFDDPPSITAAMTNTEAKLAVYRRVRDEIRAFLEALPQNASLLGTEEKSINSF
ncbi:MAG: arsenate reductase ArsC [Acidobacteriota bacterium]|jgi:arsenate reductase|nr:arsenate reductase ArsC [Acidobacteriota bacterium]